MGIDKQDTKVHLVLLLNQNTLSYLDAFVTMWGGDKMAHLEPSMKDCTVSHMSGCLVYLKQGELSELARQ